jgi:hypothetical protein
MDRGIGHSAPGETPGVALMIWLIVLISINAGLPQVLEKVPYGDMQSCQAEKAVRDSRQAHFVTPNGTSIERKVFLFRRSCSGCWLGLSVLNL